MNAREVIARHLCKRAGQGWSGISPYERGVYRTRAHNILAEVDAAGFTIMSKEDVEAVREALEPFANRAFQFDGADDDWFCNPSLQVKHLRAADDAIRSLKSGERDVD